MQLDDLLRNSKLIVVLGRGGVGKTTVSATLGIRAATLGIKSIIVTVDPANRLADAIGVEGSMNQPTRVEIPNTSTPLHGLMLDRKETCDELVKRFAKDKQMRERIFKNPYYQYFSTSLSGGQEYMAIEKVRQLLTSDEYELVVLDTPPAHHAFDFLDAPRRFIRGLKRLPASTAAGPTSILGRLKQKGGKFVMEGLKRFTGGPFLIDLTEFLSLFRHILIALEKSSSVLEVALSSSTTSFVYIDIEDHRLNDRLRVCENALSIRNLVLRGLILNRATPDFSESEWQHATDFISEKLSHIINKDQLATLLENIGELRMSGKARTEQFRETLEAGIGHLPTWRVPMRRNWMSNVRSLHALSMLITSRS